MAIRVFDCWYHDQDIREALDRPGYLEGPVADLSLGRIPPKGLPYVVGKKAGAPPDSTVVFEVAGIAADRRRGARAAGGPRGAARRARRRRRRSTLDDGPPHVRAARGRPVDRRPSARAEGVVRIEGDQELGNRIVDNMAFTI